MVSFQTYSQEILVDISTYSSEFKYEIRYATENNFMGEVLYDCTKCLLRKEVAAAFLKAAQYFCEKGYFIKIYDCYRPVEIQKKMWKKVPNGTYVANPFDGGSIHNKGAAVDITIVTLDNCFMDMGTDYDHFGPEAHIDNFNFSEEILANRQLLFDGMKQFGFSPIRSEWWHFSYLKNRSYPLLNVPLPCID